MQKKSIFMSIISVLAAITIMLSVTACGSSDNTDETKATTATEVSTQAQTEEKTEAQTDASTDAPTDAPADNNAAQQNSDEDPVMPNIAGQWKNENNPNGCTLSVNIQNGNTIDFTITSVRGNAAQIATSDVSVTLDTEYDGNLVRGYAEFDYTDSFGNVGTGIISASENVITLVITPDESNTASWGIGNCTGDYIFYSE